MKKVIGILLYVSNTMETLLKYFVTYQS